MPYGASDILAMMRGPLGCDVISDTESVRGFLDEEDVLTADTTGEQILVRQTVVRIGLGSLELSVGDDLTADGTDYTVRDLQRESDGAILKVLVARA